MLQPYSLTLQVSESAVLLDNFRLGWKPPILRTKPTADISVLWKLHPHGSTIHNKVQLIKQSGLIPSRKRPRTTQCLSLPVVKHTQNGCWNTLSEHLFHTIFSNIFKKQKMWFVQWRGCQCILYDATTIFAKLAMDIANNTPNLKTAKY